jgi:hypothetical protein
MNQRPPVEYAISDGRSQANRAGALSSGLTTTSTGHDTGLIRSRALVRTSTAPSTGIVKVMRPAMNSAATVGLRAKREEAGGRVSYVAPQRKPRPPSEVHWIELASPTSVKHGTEFIIVGADAGRLSQLRVDAYAGTVILLRVRVFANDGTVQTVQLGRTLDRTHKSVVIDLFAWKAIDQIAITTETRTQGKYTVYGSSQLTRIADR